MRLGHIRKILVGQAFDWVTLLRSRMTQAPLFEWVCDAAPVRETGTRDGGVLYANVKCSALERCA